MCNIAADVLFSKLSVLKLGMSCVVYSHNDRLGRMWTYNFAGGSEFQLLLQDAKGSEL